jgi:uncharacterized membrane protein (UPF0127 family)
VKSAFHPRGARRRPSERLLSSFLLAACLAAAVVSLSACAANEADSSPPDARITIRDRSVAIEIADTAEKQALGLGERDDLAWDHGMLFPYERPGFRSFWMKGMRFSIDIVWILDGRIVAIDPNVPFEKGGNGPILQPESLIDAVLEVPAGYAAARGWRIGDRVVTKPVQPSE